MKKITKLNDDHPNHDYYNESFVEESVLKLHRSISNKLIWTERSYKWFCDRQHNASPEFLANKEKTLIRLFELTAQEEALKFYLRENHGWGDINE